jgi:uncharacterized protein (DUF2384 family)
MKTYKATIRTEVEMTEEQYKAHLEDRKATYTRLIVDQDQRLARAKKSWSKKVDEYEAEVKRIDAELQAMNAVSIAER